MEYQVPLTSALEKLAVCDVTNLPYMDINGQSISIYGYFVTSLLFVCGYLTSGSCYSTKNRCTTSGILVVICHQILIKGILLSGIGSNLQNCVPNGRTYAKIRKGEGNVNLMDTLWQLKREDRMRILTTHIQIMIRCHEGQRKWEVECVL